MIRRFIAAVAIVLVIGASNDPVRSAESDAGSKAWLSQINQYRTLAGLDPVEEDPKSSAGDLNHARYLVKRFEVEMPDKVDVHGEGRDTAWSTPSGALAATLSNIALRTETTQPADEASQVRGVIDDWMSDPFERMPILDPELRKVGFGVYREKGFTTIVLQVRTPPPPAGEVPVGNAAEYEKAWTVPRQSSRYPIMFPSSGATVALGEYSGGGSPNPLSSCNGYGPVTGLPITLELGPVGRGETVTSHSLTTDKKPLEHCVFIASTYSGFGADETLVGRQDLTAFGAIVLIPRNPLSVGSSYTVSIVTDLKEYRWTFTVR